MVTARVLSPPDCSLQPPTQLLSLYVAFRGPPAHILLRNRQRPHAPGPGTARLQRSEASSGRK